MKHDAIREALKSLPRVEVDPRFTQRVLEELDRRSARRAIVTPRHLRLAAGLMLLALAVWQGGQRFGTSGEGEVKAREAQLEQARREYVLLLEEMASLRQLAEESQPVLFLGRTEKVEVYLDLGERAVAPAVEDGAVRPAVYQM